MLAFIDDTLLQGDTEQDCQSAMMATCQVFDSLGFTVHPVKSVLQPTHTIEFLEFWLDLVNMIVSLTDRKVEKIRSVCVELLKWKCVPLEIRRKLLVILLRLTLVFGVVPVFCKEWRLLKCSSF